MGRFQQRTDLALEARQLVLEQDGTEISGAEFTEGEINGIKFQLLQVKDSVASEILEKPRGKYCTLDLDPVVRRDKDAFQRATGALGKIISDFLSSAAKNGPVLLAGLGNRAITPDAVGPLTLEALLVTRHLKKSLPEDFSGFRDVAAAAPGVLGTSGIESAEYIKCLCRELSPSIVIAVDALAARDARRLCRTVQITDTGITPGSGVGNSRAALNFDFLGVPVIALGVPTVVDIRTMLEDLGAPVAGEMLGEENKMIVTPRSIDSDVRGMSRLLGYSLNIALHKGLTIEDVDMLLG